MVNLNYIKIKMKKVFVLLVMLAFANSVAYAGFIYSGPKYYLVKTIFFTLENGQEVIDFDPSEADATYCNALITDDSVIISHKDGKKFIYDYEGRTKNGDRIYSRESDYQPFFNTTWKFYVQVEKGEKTIVLYDNNNGYKMFSIYKIIEED